jgi:micrococcal nuclease
MRVPVCMSVLGFAVALALVGCSGPQARTASTPAIAEVVAEFESGERGDAGDITGPLSFVMTTGEGEVEVRLAEIEAPEPELATAWLEANLGGAQVRLAYDGERRDRYDRALAHAFIVNADSENWVQAELVSAGLARVLTHPDNRTAAGALLALEDEARRAARGLWGDRRYRVRDTDPDVLAQDIGSVQLVEGRVLEVTQLRSGRTYLNFGSDYRSDFTILVEARDREAFEAILPDGAGLAGLATRRIRVRGWLQDENGPMIKIDHPERIELLED